MNPLDMIIGTPSSSLQYSSPGGGSSASSSLFSTPNIACRWTRGSSFHSPLVQSLLHILKGKPGGVFVRGMPNGLLQESRPFEAKTTLSSLVAEGALNNPSIIPRKRLINACLQMTNTTIRKAENSWENKYENLPILSQASRQWLGYKQALFCIFRRAINFGWQPLRAQDSTRCFQSEILRTKKRNRATSINCKYGFSLSTFGVLHWAISLYGVDGPNERLLHSPAEFGFGLTFSSSSYVYPKLDGRPSGCQSRMPYLPDHHIQHCITMSLHDHIHYNTLKTLRMNDTEEDYLIVATTTTSAMRKRPRCLGRGHAVQFHDRVQVAMVPYWVSVSVPGTGKQGDGGGEDEERVVHLSDVWYTSKDFDEMSKRDTALIKSVSSDVALLAKSRHRGRGGSPIRSHSSDSLLGLETRSTRTHRRKRMDDGWYSVFLEQERQWEMEIVDPERIAQSYRQAAHEARQQAHTRAVKLASCLACKEARRKVAIPRRLQGRNSSSSSMQNHPFILQGDKPAPAAVVSPLSPSAGTSRWVATSSCRGSSITLGGQHRDSLLLLNSLRVPTIRR